MALFEELEDELTTRLVRAFYTTPMYDTHPKREGRPRSEYYAVLLKWLGDSDFPQAAERLTGDSRELLEAISRGDRKTPEPSSLGNTDVAEAEESLDRLLDEAGF